MNNNIYEHIKATPNTTPEQQKQALMFIRELVGHKQEVLEDGTLRVYDKDGILRMVLGALK